MLGSKSIIVGISGATTSGKTTVADLLEDQLHAHLVHQDHFFNDKRISQLLNGNFELDQSLDHDRLLQEVTKQALKHQLVVVEGFRIYSNPELLPLFHIKIYLDIDEDTLRQRRMSVNKCTEKYFDQCIIPSVREYRSMSLGLDGMEVVSGTLSPKEVLARCMEILKTYK